MTTDNLDLDRLEALLEHTGTQVTLDADVLSDLIAAARERDAVVEVHRPVHRVFSWNSGVRDEEPCPDCHGKAGVHECGCWADEDMTYSCAECRSEKGGGVDWPCPTIRALDAATRDGGAE